MELRLAPLLGRFQLLLFHFPRFVFHAEVEAIPHRQSWQVGPSGVDQVPGAQQFTQDLLSQALLLDAAVFEGASCSGADGDLSPCDAFGAAVGFTRPVVSTLPGYRATAAKGSAIEAAMSLLQTSRGSHTGGVGRGIANDAGHPLQQAPPRWKSNLLPPEQPHIEVVLSAHSRSERQKGNEQQETLENEKHLEDTLSDRIWSRLMSNVRLLAKFHHVPAVDEDVLMLIFFASVFSAICLICAITMSVLSRTKWWQTPRSTGGENGKETDASGTTTAKGDGCVGVRCADGAARAEGAGALDRRRRAVRDHASQRAAGDSGDADLKAFTRERLFLASLPVCLWPEIQRLLPRGGHYDCTVARPRHCAQALRIEGRVEALAAGSAFRSPMTQRECVMFSTSMQRRLPCGKRELIAVSSRRTDFFVALAGTQHGRVQVEGGDVALVDMVEGHRKARRRSNRRDLPEGWKAFVQSFALPGQAAAFDRSEVLEFEEHALLVGSVATFVGELRRDASGALAMEAALVDLPTNEGVAPSSWGDADAAMTPATGLSDITTSGKEPWLTSWECGQIPAGTACRGSTEGASPCAAAKSGLPRAFQYRRILASDDPLLLCGREGALGFSRRLVELCGSRAKIGGRMR